MILGFLHVLCKRVRAGLICPPTVGPAHNEHKIPVLSGPAVSAVKIGNFYGRRQKYRKCLIGIDRNV